MSSEMAKIATLYFKLHKKACLYPIHALIDDGTDAAATINSVHVEEVVDDMPSAPPSSPLLTITEEVDPVINLDLLNASRPPFGHNTTANRGQHSVE